ncbi:hypothetical protein N474_04205 [Pseudoalteromonas luteoviolacea CPMOR-2]|uniref:Solute-binding protein family 3/N-terminal domain-containing protein n=1 Tax=Pseudoalteromonas luteoviolacea DSM 6061 TaxID=1365250 RepID=A0A167BP33_9GAMM|nr:hypothetical protein [Pseudoalteromonas luteoviolacea]KZN46750.1 hypothetical protein N475_07015 [Pseudoalteromonas luteoviolacea DSM 6061]KZN50585.1 hypothetical protein N474_04205 [Pseudoalteromonas luteoviolacea CPMOR-2]MBE0384955.1 hypothetical protein [Pseudoalteromonas luteoviolacea DSM 6061]
MDWKARKTKFRHFIAFCILGLASESKAQTQYVDIYIRDDVYVNYSSLLKGRSPLEVNDFRSQFVRRDVVDMVLLQKALLLGGFEKPFKYRPGNVNFRNSNLLEQGKQLLSFDTYWLEEAQSKEDKLFISEPVVRKGEFFAGLYYAKGNRRARSLSSLEELKKLTAVSSSRWVVDWRTLSDMPLKELVNEPNWAAQAQMVNKQWADFMLIHLMPKAGNDFKLEGINLEAHPEWVVLLDSSRHFVVSKLHPDGERAFAALQRGLKKLRLQGKIVDAYRQAGLIPDMNKYKQLNVQFK